MPQTIHIFSGSFDSWEAAESYSQQDCAFSEDSDFAQEYYQAWKKRNPQRNFMEDLSISYKDLKYIETIFGIKEIFSYLDLQIIKKKDREFIRTCISGKLNTLVAIVISTSASEKINLISTPKLKYHGEFKSYDDSENKLLREQKKAKFNREIGKKRQELEAEKTAIKDKFFAKCKRIHGDTSSGKWTEYSLANFFLNFRANPDGLRELFWSIPNGGYVLSRLKNCFDASKTKADRSYLLGGDGREMGDRELIDTAIQLLNSFKEMGQCINDREFVAALTPIPEIQLIEETEPESNVGYSYPEALDLYIYDVQHQWFATLSPLTPEALWMKEAFYYLNCDYYLARYISWHWYQHSSTIKDPYLDYYQLWRHGVELRCIAPGDIRLYRHKPVEKVSLETTNYDKVKKDVLQKLDKLLQENCDRNIEKTLELWLDFSRHPFFKYTHRADESLLFPNLAGGEESYTNLCKVGLYSPDYVLKFWNGQDINEFGTDNFFPIAGTEYGDALGFISRDLSSGIAMTFHDTFTYNTIEQELEMAQKRLSLTRFFQILDLW